MRSCNDHVKSSELVLAGRSISWENNSNDVMDFSQCHLAIKGSINIFLPLYKSLYSETSP